MNNTLSLNLNKDFKRLYYNARYRAGKYIVVYLIKNRLNYNRLGITTSKKIGNSVIRNRAKRIIIAAYTKLELDLPFGYDFVIVARKNIISVNSNDIYIDLKKYVFNLL